MLSSLSSSSYDLGTWSDEDDFPNPNSVEVSDALKNDGFVQTMSSLEEIEVKRLEDLWRQLVSLQSQTICLLQISTAMFALTRNRLLVINVIENQGSAS